jgi:response regulator RpfG family c-di-GMP phosphodiesterase
MGNNSDRPSEETEKPIVIFLDDEEPILRALERTFRREIFEVRVTADIDEAIRWTSDSRARLIVSDYRMDGRTGLEVLKIVKETNPRLKRFILSGYADEELIQNALTVDDVNQYLLKPWNVDDLRARILSAVA